MAEQHSKKCESCGFQFELSETGFTNHVEQCEKNHSSKKVRIEEQKRKPERDIPATIEKLESENRAPWLTADYVDLVMLDNRELFNQLRQFFKDYLALNDERYYDVLTSWTLHTWLIEKWRATGPLYLLGPISSGKTTVLECLEQVAYRGIRGGSMSNSTMFRLSDAYQPTLLVDESQLYNREEWAETQAFLNERYRKGGKVWRVEGEQGSQFVPRSFNAYGATALAGSDPPWDAMYSRSLIVQMSKDKPTMQTLTPEFERRGKELRAHLRQYRTGYDRLERDYDALDKLLDERGRKAILDRLVDTTEYFPDPREAAEAIQDYRVREVGFPLMALAPIKGPRENVISYLHDLEEAHQALDKNSYLSEYIIALDQAEKQGTMVTIKAIRLQLAVQWEVKTDSKEVPHPKTVMKAMRTLGFKETRLENGMAIVWDETIMARWRRQFATFATVPTAAARTTL